MTARGKVVKKNGEKEHKLIPFKWIINFEVSSLRQNNNSMKCLSL